MDKRKILKRILILNMVFVILFNHIQIIGECYNVVKAADIEVEELQEEDQEYDKVDGSEEGSEIEIEEIEKDDNETDEEINENEESSEIEEIVEDEKEVLPIENAKIDTNVSLNKKIHTEKGLYVQQSVLVTIQKNSTIIDKAVIELGNFSISGHVPNRVFVNKRYNLSENNNIKIEEDLTDNEDDKIELKYVIDLEYEKFDDIEIQPIIGNIHIENTEEIYDQAIEISIEDDKETIDVYNNYNLNVENQSIYKGFLRANLVSDESYETLYSVINNIEVDNVEEINQIIINDEVDKFSAQNEMTQLNKKIKYNKTKISKDNYDEIVGMFGFIEIYSDGSLIGTIDSNTEVVNDEYVFDYPIDVDHVSIVINNPNKNGTITINHEKSIKSDLNYSDQEISNIDSIVIKSNESVIKIIGTEDIELAKAENSTNITLEETYSKIDLEMDKNVFSSEGTNDISFKILIDNNSEKYELFKNPNIEITLPDFVEEIVIENVYLLHKNGLNLNLWNVKDSASGNKVINISLNGKQQKYTPGYSVNETQIIVNAKIRTNQIIPDLSGEIELRYTNDASQRIKYLEEGKTCDAYTIQHKSKNGLLNSFQVNNKDKVSTSINTKNDVIELDNNTDSYNLSIHGKYVNNFYDKIEDVSVICKAPSFGVKNSDDEVLNNTINMKLVNAISNSDLIEAIYYSPKVNCTVDDDSWIQNPSNIEEMKSIKMQLKDNTLNRGESIDCEYILNVPEKLGLNQSAYMVYTVFYNYNNEQCKEDHIINLCTENGIISEKECQTKVDLNSIENKAELTIGTRATISGIDMEEGQEIYEGQIIRYSILLENTSGSVIKNIIIKEKAINGNIYYLAARSESDGNIVYDWYEDIEGTHNDKEIKIEELMPGEKRALSFEVFARKQQGDDIYATISVNADGMEEHIINTIGGKIVNSEYELELFSSQNNLETGNLKSSSNQDLSLRIRNNSANDKQNINVKVILPKLVSLNTIKSSALKDYIIDYNEQDDKNILLMVVDYLPSKTDLYYTIPLSIADIPMDRLNESISIIARIDEGEEAYVSNDYYKIVEQSKTIFEASITSNYSANSIVKNGDEIEYTLNIKNIGKVRSSLEIGAAIPDGIKVESIEIKEGNDENRQLLEDISKIQSYCESFNIEPDENILIVVKGKIDCSRLNVEQDEIVYDVYTSQFEIEPYTLKVDEKSIVLLDWYEDCDEEHEIHYDEDGNEVITYDEDTEEEYEENTRIEEIYTGIGPTSANIELDTDKYYIPHTNEEESTENVEDIANVEMVENSNEEDNTIVTSFEDIQNESDELEVVEEVDTKEISGTAWLDQNRDGINNDDVYLENIDVYLYKNDIYDENKVSSVRTERDGTYRFEEVEDGDYYIVFDYDESKYNTTKYSNDISAVNELDININNHEKIYAVSEKISAESVNDINIGLIEKSYIDFDINSYIESVTVINDDDVKKVEFNSEDTLPKVEISRKDITDAIVRVKYVINVTNVGNISGSVIQLKDIIPEGFIFEEGQNLNWKVGTDGAIYNSSLQNEKINPNESKTISLVLTKEKETQVLGTFTNNAEIITTSNDMLIDENNLDNNQDNQDLIISIQTGALTYICVVLLVIIILAIVVLLLVNKIIDNKTIKARVIKLLIIAFIIIAILLLISNSFAISTKKVNSINSIDEFLGKDNTNSSITSYSEFKELSEALDLFINTKRTYSLSSEYDERVQFLNRQDEKQEGTDTEVNYGISSIYSVQSNNSSYRTLANNDVVYTGESIVSSKIAFMGYLIDSKYGVDDIDNEEIKYNLARLLYYTNKNNINVVRDDSSDIKKIIGTSYSLDYNINENDVGLYEKMASKYMQYKNDNKNSSVEKINTDINGVYNIIDDCIGPIYINAPKSSTGKYIIQSNESRIVIGDIISSDNYLEYYSIDDKEWKGLQAELIYNDTVIGKSGEDGKIDTDVDLSNKTFLIRILNNDAKTDVAQIRFRNKHNEYEATGINFEYLRDNNKELKPDISIIKGIQNEVNSEVTWKYSAYNVSLNNYAYRIYKSENDKITDVVVDTIGDRADFEEQGKYFNPIGTDLKDIIITCIEFKNNGRAVDGFRFTAKADAQLTYLGCLESVPEAGVPEIKKSIDKEKWKITIGDNRTYTYNGKVNTDESVKIYLAYRLDSSENKNEKIGEIVELEYLNSDSNNILDLLDGSSMTSNSEAFEIRKSFVDISSTLYSVNGDTYDFREFKQGDEIVIKTNISNRSDDYNSDYGTIYNVQYSSNYTLDDDKNIDDYLEFNGFSLVPGDFSIKGVDYLERTDNGENDFSFDLKLDLGILPGDAIDVYSSYTIKQMDEENGIVIHPNNELQSIDNRNGDLEVSNVEVGPLIRGVDDIVVKDYKLTISKTIDSVKTTDGTNVSDKTKVESGDVVKYKITVTGDGTAPQINKTQYVIIVLDYSNSMIFWRNFSGNGIHDDEAKYGGRCFNVNHWKTGKHRSSNGSRTGIHYGCVDRLDKTREAINKFTSELLKKNSNNRVALTMFAGNRIFNAETCDDSFYWNNRSRMEKFTNNASDIASVLTDLNKYNSSTKRKPNVGMSTHFNEGFTRAQNIINNNKSKIPADAQVSIVFMSDGEAQLNGNRRDTNYSRPQWYALQEKVKGKTEANALKKAGYTIYSVGIGRDSDYTTLKALSSNGNPLHINEGSGSGENQMVNQMNGLASEIGGKTINADDYLKIKELKLKDTLPTGMTFNSISDNKSSWSNGTITYTNSTGVAAKKAINIYVEATVTRKSKTSARLTNSVYIDKVTSIKNQVLFSETNSTSPKYKASVSTQYQIYKGSINKYINKLGSTTVR